MYTCIYVCICTYIYIFTLNHSPTHTQTHKQLTHPHTHRHTCLCKDNLHIYTPLLPLPLHPHKLTYPHMCMNVCMRITHTYVSFLLFAAYSSFCVLMVHTCHISPRKRLCAFHTSMLMYLSLSHSIPLVLSLSLLSLSFSLALSLARSLSCHVRCVAMCCSVLRRGVVCCTVLYCVAACVCNNTRHVCTFVNMRAAASTQSLA